jgi:hypothetical protein
LLAVPSFMQHHVHKKQNKKTTAAVIQAQAASSASPASRSQDFKMVFQKGHELWKLRRDLLEREMIKVMEQDAVPGVEASASAAASQRHMKPKTSTKSAAGKHKNAKTHKKSKRSKKRKEEKKQKKILSESGSEPEGLALLKASCASTSSSEDEELPNVTPPHEKWEIRLADKMTEFVDANLFSRNKVRMGKLAERLRVEIREDLKEEIKEELLSDIMDEETDFTAKLRKAFENEKQQKQ